MVSTVGNPAFVPGEIDLKQSQPTFAGAVDTIPVNSITSRGGALQPGDSIIIGDDPETLGPCPEVGFPPGPGTILQMVDATTITAGNSVACSGDMGATTTANAFARCYSPSAEGVPVGMPVSLNSLTFAVEAATGMDDIPIDINIYRDTNGCPPPGGGVDATSVLICQKNILVDMAQSATLITVPLGVVIPANSHFIVEVAQPDDGSGLYGFFIGSNTGVECGPSYLRSADCGINGWATFASIGFGNVRIVQSLNATVGGTPATCGNGAIEGCEQCDDGNVMNGDGCSSSCISEPTGACCTGVMCAVVAQGLCAGTYLGDGTVCMPNPCNSGACCLANGQTCRDRVCVGGPTPGAMCASNADCGAMGTCPGTCDGGAMDGAACTNAAGCPGGFCVGTGVQLATCTAGGGTLEPATDCGPNCCNTPARLGDDDCTLATGDAPPVPVPGSVVRNGNTSTDVFIDPACAADLGATTVVRWEEFTISGCANVTIDLCCSDPTRSPLFTDILYNGCGCPAAGMFTANGYSSVFVNGTLPPICPDAPANWHAEWNDLPAGTYRYPIFVTDGTTTTGNHDYTLHVTTTPCALGRCCTGPTPGFAGSCVGGLFAGRCCNVVGDCPGGGTCTGPAAGCCQNNVDESTCEAGGGTWGGGGAVCTGNACNTGACCVGGTCSNSVNINTCIMTMMGAYFPGTSCNLCEGGSEPLTACGVDADCAGGGTCTGENVVCPPSNDDCADRTTITDGVTIVDNRAATTDGPPLNDACGNMICAGGMEPADTGCFTDEDCTMGGTCTGMGAVVDVFNDVWYNYTAECTGELTVSGCVFGICQAGNTGDLCASDADCGAVGACPLSLFDATLAIYDGTACPPTTLLGCDDDDPDCIVVAEPTVTVPVVGGQSYKIRVGGFSAVQNGVMALAVGHRATGGACCAANGTCSNVANAGACAGGIFRAGLCCSETTCPIGNSCDWPNGPIDPGGAGLASQFAPGEFYAEAADNFILTGSAANDCELDGINFSTSHFNVSAMCVPPGCLNTPDDYAGIRVAIYEDATTAEGTTKDFNFDVMPDLAITDCDGATDVFVTDARVINTDPGTFIDLDVDLDISHSFVGDLIVELSHNNGMDTVTQRLVQRAGVANNNPLCSGGEGFDPQLDDPGALTDDIVVVLDDEDTNIVETGPFPLNGRYRPFPGTLSAFDGRTKNGTWTISVQDAQGGDVGTLNAWSLHFTNSGNEGVPKGPDGTPNVADGSHTGNLVVDQLVTSFTFTQPDPMLADFNISIDLSSLNVTLDKNVKYWVGLAPEVPFTNFYQTAVAVSASFDSNPSQQIFPELGITDWTKNGGTDLAFVINGTKPVSACPCSTAADCRNTMCAEDNACNCAQCVMGSCVFSCAKFGNTNCDGMNLVNLDDILCVLSGFAAFVNCPNGDVNPCGGNGIINLDDILSTLAAFSGANQCGCNQAGTPPMCGSISP